VPRHRHRVSYLLERDQEERISCRDIPRFNHVWTFSHHFEIEYLQLLLLLPLLLGYGFFFKFLGRCWVLTEVRVNSWLFLLVAIINLHGYIPLLLLKSEFLLIEALKNLIELQEVSLLLQQVLRLNFLIFKFNLVLLQTFFLARLLCRSNFEFLSDLCLFLLQQFLLGQLSVLPILQIVSQREKL